jgi:hypothetical protein
MYYSIPAAINMAVIIIVENRVIPAMSIFVFNNCSFIQFGFIPASAGGLIIAVLIFHGKRTGMKGPS